jgi:hypothetical protein
MPFNEWDISEKVIGGTGAGAAAVYVIQKMVTFWKNESNNQASASATIAQFEALRNQIKAQDDRIAAQDVKISVMLTELQRQDGVIHKQQTKLTRTEVLVRQLVGIIKASSVIVPPYIQAELDDLINPRDPDSKTRSSDS